MNREEAARQIERMKKLLVTHGGMLNEQGLMLIKRCIFARMREGIV